MLDTEGHWSEALANNNIKAIIRWLRKVTAEGDADVGEVIHPFSCWVQQTAEFAKKELSTLCFSRCQGLWMFLDRSSFTRVHMLLQRLRNLFTLAQWGRKQLRSAHLWHGVGVPCMVCKDTCSSSDIQHGCWNREHRTLKRHIWLGQLVQWWGMMGLLPKFPETQEMKRISQMWKEMDHSHRNPCLETPGCEDGEMGRFSSLIQSMVTQLGRQHGCIWMSEDCTDPRYPPPNLQVLLKLVLIPHIDNMSIQAILMYFILDVANFLQCKDDLLQSFCHAFTIPTTFSQQVRAFWMFDHGHIKASMELLLSPKASVPTLPWQHHCIIHCLLTRKQPQEALRYLQWTRPAIETTDDAKLFADVLIQSSCNSDARALLKRSHTENEAMIKHFLQTCKGAGLSTEALKYIPVGYSSEEDGDDTTELKLMKNEMPPCPLSAQLYQAQKMGTLSTEEQIKLVRKAAKEVRKPHPKLRAIVWPEHTERKPNSRRRLLFSEALHYLTRSPLPVDTAEETQQTAFAADPEQEHPVIYNQQQEPETQENVFSSSEDLRSLSASSSTSASPFSLLKRDPLHVYKSTLTLQRISSLLTDEGNQSGEEKEKEEHRTDVFQNIPELVLTPDGATEPISFSSLNKDSMVELMLSADGGEDVEVDVFLGEDINVDGLSKPSTYESLLSDTSFTEIPSAHCDQAKEIQQGCSSRELSCTPSETTHDGLTDLHQSRVFDQFLLCGSSGTGEQDSSFLSSVCCSTFPTSLNISGNSVNPSPTCNAETTFVHLETKNEHSSKSILKNGEPSASGSTDHCKAGNWWKQGAETCRVSRDLLTATEPRAAITADNKIPSLVLGQPYIYGLVNFMDFTAKQKGDNKDGKQAEKDEPTGWSSLRKVSQGAIRSGRAGSRKTKRVKRT